MAIQNNRGDSSVGKSLIEMQRALLGIANQESDVLGDIKIHLDALLGNIYTQTREYQETATLDAMISDAPITQADPAIIEGIDHVSKELNAKNDEIKKLKRLLALLGVDTTPEAGQSVELLRQTLEELNKRNRILREIQRRLIQHPLITGQVPQGITSHEIKRILVKLNDEIRLLNNTNHEIKQQIKMSRLQSLHENKKPEPDQTPRRGPKL